MKKEYYNLIVAILFIFLAILVTLIMVIESDRSPKLSPEEKELLDFEICVNNSGLILYGRHNSQVFLAQKEDLGEFFNKINFIDCLEQRKECEGILLIPAWRLNDKLYYGSFSKDILIKLMGCE